MHTFLASPWCVAVTIIMAISRFVYFSRSMVVWYMVDMGVCEERGVELLGWNIIVQRKGPLQ
jgi:hypothetical protein